MRKSVCSALLFILSMYICTTEENQFPSTWVLGLGLYNNRTEAVRLLIICKMTSECARRNRNCFHYAITQLSVSGHIFLLTAHAADTPSPTVHSHTSSSHCPPAPYHCSSATSVLCLSTWCNKKRCLSKHNGLSLYVVCRGIQF